MLKFLSIGSGSCGNAYYIGEDGKNGVLIDAGVSFKRIKRVLAQNHIPIERIAAVLITHSHLDHMRSLDSICKHQPVPVYIAEPLKTSIAHHPFTQVYTRPCLRTIAEGESKEVLPGFFVKWFEVPHDAPFTSAFFIETEGHKIVHITDCGKMTDEALEYCRQADTVTIESNYDENMLIKGKYEQSLKERILRGTGHLSNEACAEAIRSFYHKGLRNLFLCHRSDNNNTEELALESARSALRSIGVDLGEVNLRVLKRVSDSPIVNL